MKMFLVFINKVKPFVQSQKSSPKAAFKQISIPYGVGTGAGESTGTTTNPPPIEISRVDPG
jgi:hypothetical protein